MAGVFYITEYQSAGRMAGSNVPVAAGRPITNNNIAILASSVQSNPFNANTRMIRVHNDSTQAVFVLLGANPTAVTGTDARMAANQTEYYQVIPGDKMAVIT